MHSIIINTTIKSLGRKKVTERVPKKQEKKEDDKNRTARKEML